MNKRLLAVAVCGMFLATSVVADAASSRGGFSSSSASSSRGGMSSASRPSVTPSAPSRPSAIPTTPSNPNRGGFNSSTRPPASATVPSRSTTTTTTSTTTVNRSYSGQYVSPGGMYGGWGMGYGYSNGLLTGLIIGNMMHPHGSVMYSGGGSYNNNALLYPDGRVVDQNGRVVGTYINNQFTPIQNGEIVAQPVPADAGGQPSTTPQRAVIVNHGPSAGEIFVMVMLGIGCVVLFVILLGML